MSDKLIIFKQDGVGSVSWYLSKFKENPDRKGFSWLRKEGSGAPQFEDLKDQVEILVERRYLHKETKEGMNSWSKYTVTTLGHRYLEEHKFVKKDVDKPVADLIGKKQGVEDVPVFKPSEVSGEGITFPVPKKELKTVDDVEEYMDEEIRSGRETEVLEKSKTPKEVVAFDKHLGDTMSHINGHLAVIRKENIDRAMLTLGEILYEKFGDQVTAKELIERMKKL